MQTRVKIISCSDALFWYNQHIGEVFDVIGTEDEIYWVREPSGYKNFILRKDAQNVEIELRVEEKPTEQSSSALDVQISGSHYKSLKIQPIEFIHANNIPFIEGNVIKYICRWRSKNGIKDLEKAKHYIDLLIELEKLKGQ